MSFTLKTVFVALLAVSASAAPVEVNTRATSSKKGVAYNDKTIANGFKGTASWGYNWAETSGGLDPSIEYVPMVHGPSNAAPALNGVKHVLGYNEPDMTVAGGGCATAPGAAASAWKTLVGKLNGVQIGSPAITSNNSPNGATGGPSGLTWMKEFVPAAGGAAGSKIDFVNLHWYGVQGKSGKDQATLLQSYLKDASSQINGMFGGKNMPIWLTEFAALPTTDQQVQADFLNAMIPFLDGYAPVQRYSPFMAANNYLTATSVSGKAFISAH